MRAKEFTINIPVNLRITSDGNLIGNIFNDIATLKNPELNVEEKNPYDGQKPMDQDDVKTNFVPPLQQKIELQKAAAGKDGSLVQQITADDDDPSD